MKTKARDRQVIAIAKTCFLALSIGTSSIPWSSCSITSGINREAEDGEGRGHQVIVLYALILNRYSEEPLKAQSLRHHTRSKDRRSRGRQVIAIAKTCNLFTTD